MKRRKLLRGIGAAAVVPPTVAAAAAAEDSTDGEKTCVTPATDQDCVCNCSSCYCPDKCCFCLCQ